ncbi:MAG: hypothetical protein ACRD1X_05435, partial [Vicinamibacteria bacterium]
VLILASIVAVLDVAVAGAVRKMLASYAFVIERPPGSNVLINTAGWAALGFLILSLSYAVGLIANFLFFYLAQRPLQRRFAGTALERLGAKFMMREGGFLRIGDDDKLRAALDAIEAWAAGPGDRRARRAYAQAAEDLFGRLFDYLRLRDEGVQKDVEFYVGVERACRGYIVGFGLLAVAAIFQWLPFPNKLDLGTTLPFMISLIVCAGLAVGCFFLLRYAILMEYEVRGRAFFAVRAKDKEDEERARQARTVEATAPSSSVLWRILERLIR